MSVYATSRPAAVATWPSIQKSTCTRCGITYTTRRNPTDMCRDCRDVADPPRCKSGHAMVGVNLYQGRHGKQCNACKRIHTANWRGRTVTTCCGYTTCKCLEEVL